MLQRGSYFRCPTELFNVTPYVTKICEKTFVWETFQPFTDQWLIGSFISIIVQKSSCYCRNIFSFTILRLNISSVIRHDFNKEETLS